MKAWLLDVFTDDNDKADIIGILAIVGFLAFIGLEIFSVAWKGQQFDAQAYGIGLGAAVCATATGLGLKGKWDRDGGNN